MKIDFFRAFFYLLCFVPVVLIQRVRVFVCIYGVRYLSAVFLLFNSRVYINKYPTLDDNIHSLCHGNR